MDRKYWAYLHVDGKIHLKRYREDSIFSKDAIDDAWKSPFVDDVTPVMTASNSEAAMALAKYLLGQGPAPSEIK